MLRRLFTLASAVSLLLCATMAVLWVRSYAQMRSTAETLVMGTVNLSSRTFYSAWMKSYAGRLEIYAHMVTVTDDEIFRLHVGFELQGIRHRVDSPLTIDGPAFEPASAWTAFEGAYERTNDARMGEYGARARITFPYWAACIASGLFPALWTWRRSRMQGARRVGTCVRCGYDLRATPERCPECGTPAASGVTR